MDASAPINVGVLTASISRKAGGFFWSVRSIAAGAKRLGCHVEVFSIDDQPSSAEIAHWGDLDLNLSLRRGPPFFAYAPRLLRALNEANLDLVHSHGLWMYPSIAATRWAVQSRRPLIVSPRGMLDPWAVKNSAVKKWLAAQVFENRHLTRASCIHALSNAEYEAIRRYGLPNPIAIIPNGVDLPEMHEPVGGPKWDADLPSDAKVMLYLGRLHPKKGLESLLRAWALAIAKRDEGWHLIIAGWDEGGYESELRRLADSLDLTETVRFVGPQFDVQKATALASAQAFILPSLSEGLPMAVLEAWSHRLPVLMTPYCNLPEGFTKGAAVEITTEVNSMAEQLSAFFSFTDVELTCMGNRGRRLVETQFSWDQISAQMTDVYSWILGRQEKPACVRID